MAILATDAKLSMFAPYDKGFYIKTASALRWTENRFSGNARQRRKAWRAQSRDGVISYWRKGEWVQLKQELGVKRQP